MRCLIIILLLGVLPLTAAAMTSEPRLHDLSVGQTLATGSRSVSLEVPPDELHPYHFLPGTPSPGGLFRFTPDGLSFHRPGLYLIRLGDGLHWVRVAAGPWESEIRYQTEEGETVESLLVAGSFTGWAENMLPMVRDATRHDWSVRVSLPRGRHPFKIVKNGQWLPHPRFPRQPDPFGGVNSLLLVGEPETPPQLLPALCRESTYEVEYIFRSLDGRPLFGVLLDDDRVWNGSPEGRDGVRFLLPRRQDPGWRVVCLHDADLSLAPAYAWYENPVTPDAPQPGDGVMYFLLVDRFVNGMPENDRPLRDPRLHPLTDWQGGDLAGVIRTLEDGYFDRLGVRWLWLSPLHPQPLGLEQEGVAPGHYYSAYHGYWPLTLEGVDHRFGDEKKLRKLIDRAGEHGIGLLLDMVFNHVHQSSPVFQAHPDWFHPLVLPDGSENLRRFDQHPWTTWFDRFLPAFDFSRADVADYLARSGVELLTGFGFSGFRLDAVKHIPPDFFRLLKKKTAERYKQFFFVGETLSGRSDVARYLAPDLLDGQFDFPLYLDIIQALATEKTDLQALGASIEASTREYPASAVMVNFLGNHDFPRFLAYADGDVADGSDGRELAWATTPVRVDNPQSFRKLRLAFGLLFALRGIPLIYYGDELGMTGGNDPDNRRFFRGFNDWSTTEVDLHGYLVELAALRKAHPVLSRGAVHVLTARPELLVLLRADFSERLLVVLRRRGEADIELSLPESLAVRSLRDLQDDSRYSVENGRLRLKLAEREIRFYRLEP